MWAAFPDLPGDLYGESGWDSGPEDLRAAIVAVVGDQGSLHPREIASELNVGHRSRAFRSAVNDLLEAGELVRHRRKLALPVSEE
jgi:hypothetical protein